jgi:hypothetical protein
MQMVHIVTIRAPPSNHQVGHRFPVISLRTARLLFSGVQTRPPQMVGFAGVSDTKPDIFIEPICFKPLSGFVAVRVCNRVTGI